jgi:MYXO-CTERM domain-containing protein
LYFQGAHVYTSTIFIGPFPGGGFAGLVSSMPFDEVLMTRLHDPTDPVYYDDLHFGPPIPAPGALGALGAFALAALIGRRRRRRG